MRAPVSKQFPADMASKPKNETLEGRKKKADPVFVKELHSHPELMSYSEKLELAEELFCEVISPVLEREGSQGEVVDVKERDIHVRVHPELNITVKLEIEYLVDEATEKTFNVVFKVP